MCPIPNLGISHSLRSLTYISYASRRLLSDFTSHTSGSFMELEGAWTKFQGLPESKFIDCSMFYRLLYHTRVKVKFDKAQLQGRQSFERQSY